MSLFCKPNQRSTVIGDLICTCQAYYLDTMKDV